MEKAAAGWRWRHQKAATKRKVASCGGGCVEAGGAAVFHGGRGAGPRVCRVGCPVRCIAILIHRHCAVHVGSLERAGVRRYELSESQPREHEPWSRETGAPSTAPCHLPCTARTDHETRAMSGPRRMTSSSGAASEGDIVGAREARKLCDGCGARCSPVYGARNGRSAPASRVQ